MKKIFIYGLSILMAVTSSYTLTSCIDETLPTSGVTDEQVPPTEESAEALVMGLNNQFSKIWTSSYHWSIGYAGLMIIRDIQSGELAFSPNGYQYNQWLNWYYDMYWGREYLTAQFMWQYQTGFVLAANNAIAAVDTINGTDSEKGLAGAAFAYRALIYLDMAREYEFLENDKTKPISPEGNDISGLTVPIVTEKTTEQQARNNPRAKKIDMFNFILSDLQAAEKFVPLLKISSTSIPKIDCVYGLYARLYMWMENYPMAEKYARMAINASTSQPMTKDEALNITTGFNDATKWMWGATYSRGNVSNLMNWAAFMTSENTYGYSGPLSMGGAGVLPQIPSALYNKMSKTDWRKLMFKAPEGSSLYGKNTYCDAEIGEVLEDYTATKFRPAGGNVNDYTAGNVTAFPIMRIEEMYFIEAEAAAHQDAERGKKLLETFMLSRDTKYSFKGTDKDQIIEEIVFQKQIELWGEGQSFFDIKRLGYPVDKTTSSNIESRAQFKTTSRPAWMNWAIVRSEETNNAGVRYYNNPDPANNYAK